MTAFRHKALAALLASVAGGLGAHRLYLRQPGWWLAPGLTLIALPFVLAHPRWYQAPAFFVLMVPVIAGFVEALVIALTPDERFDARFNAGSARRNLSGWDAVLVAVATLGAGAVVLITTIALLTESLFAT